VDLSLSDQVAWLAQWRRASVELEEVRKRELRALTDEAALAAADNLLSLPSALMAGPARRATSGLVEQQALFQRARTS
jgi:hypothetical protein